MTISGKHQFEDLQRTQKKAKGLPLREITPQQKWVYENELKNWEMRF